MTRILLTGGGGAGNEALWTLLSPKYEIHFADADRLAIDPSIPDNQRHEVPLANDPRFVESLIRLCKTLAIDLLVPGVDEELPVLAANRDEFLPVRIMLPGLDYIESMLDKLEMVAVLRQRGVTVPASRLLTDDLSDWTFPSICKPRTGRGSRDVSVLNSIKEAEELIARLGLSARSMMVQEKIEGTEYTVQMSADANGDLRAIVPVKVDIKRGITLRAITNNEPAVTSACRAIHEAVRAVGCYNIQLMLTPDGRAIPFEINPRVSTTLCLVVAAGVDPFSNYLGQATAGELQTYRQGLRLRRHWRNHFDIVRT
ncbi:ATP-grasp domain-containing protein [Devosia ginsengisoli]|uniref:ATP-grasp domain-containing protein n=1 Tax=Devosia ginsengisoli TaxID=400770 RepID=UPI0026F0CBD7|nr:ATP-grasp domain-containing protein [Devosia ginsengisoli]MCR6672052.1 ATP-grasp domain-containing protein [Devosia ginsengisoli]